MAVSYTHLDVYKRQGQKHRQQGKQHGANKDHRRSADEMCIRDRSIYKFRGANIKNILDFEHVFEDTKVIKLEPVSYTHLDVYKRQVPRRVWLT